jgi:putative methyltransferase (TIGR04325 family)
MAKQSRIHSGNVLPLRPSFKHVVKVMLDWLPIVGDLLLERYFYSRKSTACRGVYETMEAAQAAIPTEIHPDYDLCNESRSIDVDIERVDAIQYEDYAVLFWLQKIIRPGIRITDLGGSTGGTFYAYDDALDFPDDISWLVAELPAAVEIGTRVAEARGESRLDFTSELGAKHRPDVLVTLGTLQYMPQRLPQVLAALAALPSDVIVHRVPITDGPAYWTIQNLGLAQVPYYIHNRYELIAGVESLGYRLIDSCYTLRSIRIPFHPSRDVEHYAGFWFSRSESS